MPFLFDVFLLSIVFSQQILYEQPKTNDPHEIRFVEMDEEEYLPLRAKMLRLGQLAQNPPKKCGYSWISPTQNRPFSKWPLMTSRGQFSKIFKLFFFKKVISLKCVDRSASVWQSAIQRFAHDFFFFFVKFQKLCSDLCFLLDNFQFYDFTLFKFLWINPTKQFQKCLIII